MIVPMAAVAAVYVEDNSMLEAKCHGSEVIIQDAVSRCSGRVGALNSNPYVEDHILQCPLTCC
jgi:hypothetical protein